MPIPPLSVSTYVPVFTRCRLSASRFHPDRARPPGCARGGLGRPRHPRLAAGTFLKLLLGLSVAEAGLSAAQPGDRSDIDQSKPPAHWRIPAAPVHSPEASIRQFEIVPGFRVELVAAEPLVQDPIAIHFDERGRIWVLEWPAYNWELRATFPDLERLPAPKSRVVILEDTDNDGRMDRRTVFLEGFDWPRGLQLAGDGALVLKLPEIAFVRDRDGDGSADAQEILVAGLPIPANPHAAQSNLLRGLDNWIYGSQFARRLRHAGGTWKSQPHVSIRGQWGLSQDNYGRLIFGTNGDHLRGNLVPPHYYTRNPNYPATAGVDVQLSVDQRVWPPAVTAGVNRRAQLSDQGRLRVFTANAGPSVYRGDQFPEEFVGNVFLGDVAGRLIRRSLLIERDGIVEASNAYSGREFLFSHDERFRPVYTATGPDGALYIADMHRGVIEGQIFMTSWLRDQVVQRGLHRPFGGLGRIYRLVHDGRPRREPDRLDRTASAGWTERLSHPNGFWRDTAQRLLVERQDRGVIPALRKMAAEHASELARLHALWTLEGLAALDAGILSRALSDPAVHIRIAAIRLAEPLLDEPGLAERLLALAEDEQIAVRRQLLFSLGERARPDFEDAMLRVLDRDLDQPVTVEAVLSGIRNREFLFAGRLLEDSRWHRDRPGARRLFQALAQAVAHAEKDGELERLMVSISDAANRPRWLRLAVLDGLAARKTKSGRLSAALAILANSADEPVRARAATLADAARVPVDAEVGPAPGRLDGPVFARGRTIYAICSACHGPEGRGQPGLAPALAGSQVVTGPVEQMIAIVLHGRNQDRANPAFPDMPPLGGLPDEDIAAVISYVRARWSGESKPISTGRIRQARRT